MSLPNPGGLVRWNQTRGCAVKRDESYIRIGECDFCETTNIPVVSIAQAECMFVLCKECSCCEFYNGEQLWRQAEKEDKKGSK